MLAGRGGRGRWWRTEVLALPRRSLNYWHEGVWVSVCVRAPSGAQDAKYGGKVQSWPGCFISCCSLPHPHAGWKSQHSATPPPQLDSAKGVGARDGKVAVPTLELRGRQDFSWPLLLNLCPARCYVPTYFTSIKN